jgi:hypothetical protein
MRFPAQTRESPHFGASTRAIVKHLLATLGDTGPHFSDQAMQASSAVTSKSIHQITGFSVLTILKGELNLEK